MGLAPPTGRAIFVTTKGGIDILPSTCLSFINLFYHRDRGANLYVPDRFFEVFRRLSPQLAFLIDKTLRYKVRTVQRAGLFFGAFSMHAPRPWGGPLQAAAYLCSIVTKYIYLLHPVPVEDITGPQTQSFTVVRKCNFWPSRVVKAFFYAVISKTPHIHGGMQAGIPRLMDNTAQHVR